MDSLMKMAAVHKMGAAVLAFLAIGTGANLLARILNAIPMDWCYRGLKHAALVFGLAGDMRFGRQVFEPFEKWIVEFLGNAVDAVRDGFDEAEKASDLTVPVVAPAQPQESAPSPKP